MLSKMLEQRVVYKWRADKAFDPEGKAILDKQVRRLVLVMRGLELSGTMTREDIEDCVIAAMERAEYLYYGLSEHELMNVMDWEIANDKGRKRYK